MHTLHDGYRGLSLLMDLNWDRALYLATILLALGTSTWLATILS
ncbi:MAG: hypothetical protein R8G34_00605 [Paracoccaceae bacterium]|nr:hypothetical protein [Paracoccaceae bacterium]